MYFTKVFQEIRWQHVLRGIVSSNKFHHVMDAQIICVNIQPQEGTKSMSFHHTMNLNMAGLLETWSNIAVHSVIRFLSVKCVHWWKFRHPPEEVYRAHVISWKCVSLSVIAGQMLTISSVPQAQAYSLQWDNVGLMDALIKTTDPQSWMTQPRSRQIVQ